MERNLLGQNINDYFIYILLCVEDDTILVKKTGNDGNDNHSLISTSLKQSEGWNCARRRLARQVFAIDDKDESNIVNRVAKERAFSESRVVKILRIWHPSHLSYSSIPTTSSEKQSWPEPQYLSSYLNRITYANNVTLKDKQNYLTEKENLNDRFVWTSTTNLLASGVLDQETTDVVRKVKNSLSLSSKNEQKPVFGVRELEEKDFIFTSESVQKDQKEVVSQDRKSGNNDSPTKETISSLPEMSKDLQRKLGQATLTEAAKFSLSDQRIIYQAFFSLTVPHLYISKQQFNKFMVSTLGWPPEVLDNLFRSFNIRPKKSNEIKQESFGASDCSESVSCVQNNFLSFSEFICGLAACEPQTPHGDAPGEARCRYIFRYYDKNLDGLLEYEDFLEMIQDIRKAKGLSTTEADIQKEASMSAKVFGSGKKTQLSLNDFLVGVGQLKFRGTSVLLRSPNGSVVQNLRRIQTKDKTEPDSVNESNRKKRCHSPLLSLLSEMKKVGTEDKYEERQGSSGGVEDPLMTFQASWMDNNLFEELEEMDNINKSIIDKQKRPSLMSLDSVDSVGGEAESGIISANSLSSSNEKSDDGQDYEFATHVVKVKRSGQVIDVKSLWDMDSQEGSKNAFAVGSKFDHLSPDHSSSLQKKVQISYGRMQSVRAFSGANDGNEMLKGLRYFERAIPGKPGTEPKDALSWGSVDMQTVAASLIELCQQARNLFLQEPRLIRLNTPTYILGDIHGNFSDLICFEKVLWRMGPQLTPSNFLFLGDYVDRGAYGVEVVAYLFAQKVIAPTKFHLLRGNHEHRELQKNFTFYTECLQKFGTPELGEMVWEEINKAFDAMPIAAVVDKKVFCVHGGIPPPWLMTSSKRNKHSKAQSEGLISSLDRVSNDIPDPEETAPLVWEFLWNDPLPPESSSLPPAAQTRKSLKKDASGGFVSNFRRGTGHMFSPSALDDFLARNGLSHVIRAHEVKEAGFQVQHNRKLLTVFSSSHYCNGSNEAACVLMDDKKLRMIRLDTTSGNSTVSSTTQFAKPPSPQKPTSKPPLPPRTHSPKSTMV